MAYGLHVLPNLITEVSDWTYHSMSTTDEGCGKEKCVSHKGTKNTDGGQVMVSLGAEDSCASELLREYLCAFVTP